MNFNEKEYNSVVLASLLHDIGKVVQGSSYYGKTDKEYKSHPGIGGRLIKDLFDSGKLSKNDIDEHIVSKLITYHHDRDISENSNILGNHKPLAALVSVADSYSSKERDELDQSRKTSGNPRLQALLSCVFTLVDNYEKQAFYNISPLRQMENENIMPITEEDNTGIQSDYDEVLKNFLTDLANIQNKLFFQRISSIQGLLEEYFWAIPSATINKTNDISLYDHLVSSAAIAAALYKYHFEKNEIYNEKEIRNEETEKFLLISGEITGIQNFIFDINTLNAKGLSKELRGRSFFISLLCSIISLKILSELGLPIVSKIVDAGGKFIILAPNTSQTVKKIENISKVIIKEIVNTFGGNLIPVIEWSTTFKSSDFKNISEVMKKMVKNMARAKLRKLALDTYYETYKIETQYERYLKSGLCNSCKIYPAQNENGQILDCDVCALTKALGKFITKDDINFINYNITDKMEFLLRDNGFNMLGIEITFTQEYMEDAFYTEQIRISKGIKTKIKDVANYMPKARNKIDITENIKENTLCYYCADKCESLEDRKRIASDDSILTFQCLSAVTPLENNGLAVDHLAVLKGDVDDLGYIFSYGLGDKLSLSRYVYLSRMMNLFFTVYLKRLIIKKYKDIYTVYAGGDDFLLIGPWEQIIEAACGIRENFVKYVAGNPNIHLSVGIALFRPKQPVLGAVKKADEMLDKAKSSANKNSICIFGEANSWDDFIEIRKIQETLTAFVRKANTEDDKENMKISGIYRLLNYYNIFKEYEKTKKIEYIKYDYLLSYDIKRNYKDKPDIMQYLNELRNEQKMKLLKVPLFWTIYKNRKR